MYSINKRVPDKIRKYYIYPISEGLFLAILALLLTSATAYFIYHHALKAIKEEIKDGLLRTASGIAACLDGDLIASFDAPEKSELPAYGETLALLQKARLATKHCTYLYINKLVNGEVVFILDPTPVDVDGKPLFSDDLNLAPSIPMTKYDNPSIELREALASQTSRVSSEPYSDKWGTFYSAYVPIFNKEGQFVGTLGADLRINDMLARCQPIEDATKRAFFVSCVLSLLCGTLIWFTRRFSLQLNESRFALLANFLAARKFAAQSSACIGNQLHRTAKFLLNFSGRLAEIAEKSEQSPKQALAEEQNRLTSLAAKLQSVGDLKCGKSDLELETFKISSVPADLSRRLTSCENISNLGSNISSAIPENLYGCRQTYVELLVQMGQFFLKTFAGKIDLQIEMIDEGTKEVVLRQTMRAAVSDSDARSHELLQKICEHGKSEDFFAEIELAEAVAIPIVRELIYLLNSDISLSLANGFFSISFETMFQKDPELEEEED